LSDAETLKVTVKREGVVAAGALILIFPAGEARFVVTSGTQAEDRLSDGRRRFRVAG
jgi:hypothetical protein